MLKWNKYIQAIVDIIDKCIRNENDEALTLAALSEMVGYSQYYISRKFRNISGMTLKDYIRLRRLAFSLKELRDTKSSIIDIAVKYGFSSNESFTRAFKAAYGITPSKYRNSLQPVVIKTVIRPWDCYLAEGGTNDMGKVKIYFISIPKHKFLHIRNYESIGYWDFWKKQSKIQGQDQETICSLLNSIEERLGDIGEGQVMAWINESEGRICSWGIPLAEAYGIRLPSDYCGEIPKQMQLMDVEEGEYIVFEHGPFNFETGGREVEEKIEAAMKKFDYNSSGYELDLTPERVFYFYYDCERVFKYIRPVRRTDTSECS